MDQVTDEYNWPDDFQMPGGVGRTHVIETHIDISEDDQWSSCVDLAGYEVVGLLIPLLDVGATTFQIWVNETTDADYAVGNSHQIINSGTGAAATWTLGATPGNPPQAIGTDALDAVFAYRWVKIYLSRSQTANRTFQWVVKG